MSEEPREEEILSHLVETLQTRNLMHTEIVQGRERCNKAVEGGHSIPKETSTPEETKNETTETKVSPEYLRKSRESSPVGELQENGSRDLPIKMSAQLAGEDFNAVSTGEVNQSGPPISPLGGGNTEESFFKDETPESVLPLGLHFNSTTLHDHPLWPSVLEKEEEIVNPPNQDRETDFQDDKNCVSHVTFNTSLNGVNQSLNRHLSQTFEVKKLEKGEKEALPTRLSDETPISIAPTITADPFSREVNPAFAGKQEPQKLAQNSETLLISRFYKEELRPLKRCGSFPDVVENGVRENGSHPNFDNLFPIYRLSLRLSHCLSSTKEIPNADTHRQYEKAGYLQKMNGRGGFPYLSQWKRRYCILAKGRLFLYEKETSKGSDKNTNVVDLKYFDHVAEAHQKDTKKVSNVFVVTSQDRSFFDPGRHLFAADTLTEMHEWVNKLRESIELIRNNNRPKNAGKTHEKETNDQENEEDHPAKQEPPEQGGKSKLAPKESDTVDARPTSIKMTEKKKEEFATALELKLRRESEEVQRSSKETAELQDEERLEDKENRVQSIHSIKRSSSKISSLQIPVFNIEACPQLESVTKNRIRGPAGRRAPQTKRNAMIKDRTSSMSTLQYDGQLENTSRQEDPLEFSPVACEDEQSSTDMNSLSTSQPILAYHYSSDEDSPTEGGCIGLDRSFGMSASATGSSNSHAIASQAPKSTSFNIEEVPHHPVKGLRVYLSQKGGRTPQATKIHFSPLEGEGDCLLEYRSLPRSLGKMPTANALSTERNMPYSRPLGPPSGTLALNPHNSSTGRLSSGRASPEMDALDNLLMKRSLFSISRGQREPCGSDQDGSDASTCKAAPLDKEGGIAIKAPHDRELAKALQQFSSVLQHLQHHTAELEGRTRQIESEFSVSKNDIIHLQGATDGIRKEVKKLTETINIVSQEASKAKKEHVLQKQETERLQKDTSEALSQARQSQEQFETAKKNYDTTIRDLHSLITSIRSSIIMTEADEDLGSVKKLATSTEARMRHSEGKLRPVSESVPSDRTSQSEEPKKALASGGTASQQKGGYQSFFQRPSNLIYGLTAKSTNKMNKKDKDANKRKTEDKKKSEKRSEGLEKKNKLENQSPMYFEKGEKSCKTASKGDNPKQTEGNKAAARDAFGSSDRLAGSKRNYSGFSTENLPMMDECIDREGKPPSEGYGISRVTINLNAPQQSNYNLEKSRSSPTVSTKFANKPKRPNVLHLYRNKDTNQSHSNLSSPDSPIFPAIPPPSPPGDMHTSSQTKFASESLFSCQPPKTASPVFRQTSMPSVPEDKSTRSRPGVFAISRQKSSPNLPIQRQNSAPIFPLQRQRSLGTVPEEGQLPRQASLISVPEDRPIVDRTLPLSPTSSMLSFALSPSASGDTLDSFRERSAFRNSMELVTGPVLAGSSMQECGTRALSPSSEFEMDQLPVATSSLKKLNQRKKQTMGPVVV